MSIATTERRKNITGETEEHTTWFRVTAWGRQAELANEYLSKGRQVYIEGRLRLEEYFDREGQKRFSAEVNASELQFVGQRAENAAQPAARVAEVTAPASAEVTSDEAEPYETTDGESGASEAEAAHSASEAENVERDGSEMNVLEAAPSTSDGAIEVKAGDSEAEAAPITSTIADEAEAEAITTASANADEVAEVTGQSSTSPKRPRKNLKKGKKSAAKEHISS
jgi:single-strand DNA-binding protein